MKNKNYFWGILLIFIGIGLMINNIFNIRIFTIEKLWPLFILIPGLSFEIGYFVSRRSPGRLVPGGILTIIGILFLFETYTNWYFSEYTWPIYPFAVAVGLFQLYLFGRKSIGLLIPVFILTTISLVAFLSMIFGEFLPWFNTTLIFPIILIIIGIYILLKNFEK